MTSLTLVHCIRARPQIVFHAVTTAEGIAHWWGPDAEPMLVAEADLRVGRRYRVRFRMLDGTELESSGAFLEIARPERVFLSWRFRGGRPDPGESRVEITRSRTRAAAMKGWDGHAHRLEAHLAARTDTLFSPTERRAT